MMRRIRPLHSRAVAKYQWRRVVRQSFLLGTIIIALYGIFSRGILDTTLSDSGISAADHERGVAPDIHKSKTASSTGASLSTNEKSQSTAPKRHSQKRSGHGSGHGGHERGKQPAAAPVDVSASIKSMIAAARGEEDEPVTAKPLPAIGSKPTVGTSHDDAPDNGDSEDEAKEDAPSDDTDDEGADGEGEEDEDVSEEGETKPSGPTFATLTAEERRNVTLVETLLRQRGPFILQGIDLPDLKLPRLTLSLEDPDPKVHGRSFSPSFMAPLLPPTDIKERYPHCAVVGNSGILKIQGNVGHIIDAYDAVFRYNNAPVDRFETLVGAKTTYRAINNAWTRTYINSHRRANKRDKEKSTLLCFGNSSLRMYLKFRKLHTERQMRYLSAELTRKTRMIYKKLQTRLEQAGFGPYKGGHVMPSGMEGLFFALQLCHETHVYGFDPQLDSDVPYHYFDAVRGVTRVHSFSFQFDMLHLLHAMGMVKLCVPRYVAHYGCPTGERRENELVGDLWHQGSD